MEVDYPYIKQNFGTDYIGALRYMRDILLKDSDWTQFTDSPLSESKKGRVENLSSKSERFASN